VIFKPKRIDRFQTPAFKRSRSSKTRISGKSSGKEETFEVKLLRIISMPSN